MSEELKPCPCCGSPLVAAWSGLVQCDECHATIAGDTQEDSVAKWNRRVVTEEQVAIMARRVRGVGAFRIKHMLRAAGFEVQS